MESVISLNFCSDVMTLRIKISTPNCPLLLFEQFLLLDSVGRLLLLLVSLWVSFCQNYYVS